MMKFFIEKRNRLRSSGSHRDDPNSVTDAKSFSIDDAFDIPEEEEMSFGFDEHQVSDAPIIKRGELRLDFPANVEDKNSNQPEIPNIDNGSVTDSASLIQNGSNNFSGGGGGYYEGPPIEKFWWKHPRVRRNYKVVLAAFLLCFLGLVLVTCGIVVFCLPSFQNVQGIVFLIAGLICLVPGAYHIGYGYLAVKGKRGYEFNHLPLFNN